MQQTCVGFSYLNTSKLEWHQKSTLHDAFFLNQKFKRESCFFFQPSLLNTYDFQYNNIKLRLTSLDIEVMQQIKEYYYHYYKLTDSLNIAIHFLWGLLFLTITTLQ